MREGLPSIHRKARGSGLIRVPPINVVLAPIPRDGLAERLRAIGRPALGVVRRGVPVRARVAAGPIGLGALQRERRREVLAADAVPCLFDDERNGFGFGDRLFLWHEPESTRRRSRTIFEPG